MASALSVKGMLLAWAPLQSTSKTQSRTLPMYVHGNILEPDGPISDPDLCLFAPGHEYLTTPAGENLLDDRIANVGCRISSDTMSLQYMLEWLRNASVVPARMHAGELDTISVLVLVAKFGA